MIFIFITLVAVSVNNSRRNDRSDRRDNMSILVIGSFMMDLVTRSHRAPDPGETVIGKSFNTYLGGKGANQAVAAANLASNVTIAGMVGNDDFGRRFTDFFHNHPNIDSRHILIGEKSTGVGSITIDETGQNKIIVVPGANMEYIPEYLVRMETEFARTNIVICQLEMQMAVIMKAAEMAKKHDKLFILNPAPFQKLEPRLLENVNFLTPNETELAGMISKKHFQSEKELVAASRSLIALGVKNVIVTLGEKGAIHVTKDLVKNYPAHKVDVVDTVAAGDAFNGALAAAIDQGMSIEDAITFANAAGAMAVQKSGAIPSLPTREELDGFLNSYR